MKIGLFFGSFNPIHVGHLIVSQAVLNQSEVDEVWFVVSPQNPFKSPQSLAHEWDRLRMTELAIADHFRLRCTDIEFHLPRPSYTIDTLVHLAERYPNHSFRVIMGEDNLQNFQKWKNHDRILEYYGLIVYPRHEGQRVAQPGEGIEVIEAPLLHISATYIRKLIRDDKSLQFIVPQPVIDYINDKSLYR